MIRIFKTAILSAAVAATVLAPMAGAEAGDFRRHHRDRPHHASNDADLLAAGIFGVAIGAIVIGSINDREPAVVQPRPRPHWDEFPRAPRDPEAISPKVIAYDGYDAAAEPWSDEWFQYCEDRYRTFDPRTGTYVAKGGKRRFCIAD